MALAKTLSANGSKGHHKFTLRVSEDSTSGNSSIISYTFTISPIQNGYDWSDWGSSISYSITLGTNIYTGTIPAYNGRTIVTLKSGSNIEIAHNSDGTKTIEIEFSVSDSTNVNYTCGTASASDTFKLTDLHKAPELTLSSVQEQTNYGIADTTFVRRVSNKLFTVSYSFYDEATPTALKIYTKSNVEITWVVTTNLSSFSGTLQMRAFDIDERDVVNGKTFFILELTDSKGGKKRINTPEYNVVLYEDPKIIPTSSYIKRAGQATGEANLTLIGSYYNGTIGTTQNTLTLKFDYWKSEDTEPITFRYTIPMNENTGTGNNVEFINWKLNDGNNDIDDLDPNYSYFIGISITDNKTNYMGIYKFTLPKGAWLMAKFPNRVDFARLTVQNQYEIYPNIYSSTETIIGIDNNELRYRKVIDFGSLPSANSLKSVAHSISNLSEIKDIRVIGNDGTYWFPIPFAGISYMYNNATASIRVDDTNIYIATSADWSSYTAKVTLEYTKSS